MKQAGARIESAEQTKGSVSASTALFSFQASWINYKTIAANQLAGIGRY